MRRTYQRRLPSDTSKDYYYIIRETSPIQSLLIEYGFIDNAADLARIQNNYQDYAEAVVRAVTRYAGLPYAPPGESLPSTGTYTVKSGDTLYGIASRFNTTVDAIKQLNNLSSNTLQIGQVLRIPGATTQPPATEDYILYTVQSGDSLYAIASRYGTTVQAITSLNNLPSTVLQIGQVLKIPVSEGTTPGIPSEPGNNYITYTVKSGDTLYSIANKYDTTTSEIMSLNNLTSNVLSIGQVLRIPVQNNIPNQPGTPGVNYITYTVRSGDSLYAIANKYNVTVDDIKALNNLTSNLLSIGQTLLIPVSTDDDLIEPPQGEYINYTVVSGDNLYSIARRFNTTESAIRALNNLTTNELSIGQVLRIPLSSDSNTNYITYTVRSGDSLYSIAKRYGVSVNDIKAANNLTSNLLSIGQILNIPQR